MLEGSSDRAAYIESLELLRGLEFDVLVPWAASGEPITRSPTPPTPGSASTRSWIACGEARTTELAGGP